MRWRQLFCTVLGVTFAAGSVPAWGQCEAIELQKLVASDGAKLDFFGHAVAISGDIAVIGAFNQENSNDNVGLGKAYVFEFDGANWAEVAQLTPFDRQPDMEFGAIVAIDGDTIVVAAPQENGGLNGSGAAYVFERPPDGWDSLPSPIHETAKLTASDAAAGDVFGGDVGISGDTIVVGAFHNDDAGSNSGSAYVFEKPPGGWGNTTETQKLLASDATAGDRFGVGVAIHGNTIVIGADQINSGPGTAYVFERQSGTWVETAELTASDAAAGDRFGLDLSIFGATVVIGAFGDDDGGANAGSAYVFEEPAGGWVDMTESTKLTASDAGAGENFGSSVSLNDDNTIVVGAYAGNNPSSAGAAYVYEMPPDGWDSVPSPIHEAAKLTAFDAAAGDIFGVSVAISGSTAIVGASDDDNENGLRAGSAYVFGGLSDCNNNGTLDLCDIADGASQDANGDGIPDECEELVLDLDIKPGSCPNSFNRNSHGVLPVALVGTGSFDPMDVDLSTVLLSRADGVGGSVAPNEGPPGPHSEFEDVATPFDGPGAPGCDCHELEGDGILDLSMKFRTDDVVSALLLNDLPAGELVELAVSGTLLDGTAFSASDCIRLVPPGTPDGLLAVGSNLPGAWLDVSPLDIQLDGGGFANFERSFPLTSVVTVTAALTHQGWVFAGWRVGDLTGSGPGGALQLGQSIDITIGGEQQTAEAMYIPGFVGVRIIP